MTQPLHPRPLSPHLSVYKFHLSMALSILHRITGVALVGALAIVVVWLWAAAYSSLYFTCISDMLNSTLGLLVLGAATIAFYLKFALGLRHLFWDTGRGFDLKNVDRTGIAAILFTIGMTAITWLLVYSAV